MRAVMIALGLLVVLSGCGGFVGGPESSDQQTLTPVPVPNEAQSGTVTVGPAGCLVPPPGGGTVERPPPATPRPLPTANGRVPGDRLVEMHDRALSNHSYHLRAGEAIEIRAAPNATAFTYRGEFNGITYIRAYGVNGSLYTVERDGEGEPTVDERPYDPGSIASDRFLPSLSARDWLEDRIGEYEYRVAGTRTWNGTRVRVLEREFDTGRQVVRRKVARLNSTIYVGARGIVRYVDHDTEFRSIENPKGRPTWHNGTLRVTGVGETRVRRPDDLCGFGSGAAGEG